MICITVILLHSIFRRFISVLNGVWAVLASLGIVCSLSLNFVCKPAIERCLRTKSTASVNREAKNTRVFCNLVITCGLAAGRAVIGVALLVSCARSALGRPGLELTRSLLSRRRSSCCLQSTNDTHCWLKHICFMLGVLLMNVIVFLLEILNFVCKPAVGRCLRTRSRRSRNSIARTSLLLRVLTILLIRIIKAIKCICLAFAITSLASVLLHDLKFSDELRHQNLI